MQVSLPSPTPAAAEAARLARAERAMKQFCLDLSGLVGRVIGPSDRELEDNDLLTSEIYAAAVEAEIDIDAVMKAESSELPAVLAGQVPWFSNCCRVLAKMRRRVKESTYHRILEVWTGNAEDAADDPDAKLCLEYAEGFFDTSDKDVDALVDLATCLLDYAFTRQGLDDDLARLTKKEPAELQKALVEAGGGREEDAPQKKATTFEEHLESIEQELFVVAVKQKLHEWRPSLLPHIIKLTPHTVYRVAMARNGHAVGDPLVTKTFLGAQRHAANHSSPLVTIGHAALSLEVLLARRGIKPTDHALTFMWKEFCRECGDDLQRGVHGCCITERNVQANLREAFRKQKDREAVRQLTAVMGLRGRPRRRLCGNESYDIRETPLRDGSTKVEIHLDFWDEGIWQEVPSKDEADFIALDAIREHERARALTKPTRQGDTTESYGDYRVVSTVSTSNIHQESTATTARIEQLIICKYPTCTGYATRSRGRYCDYHAEEMRALDGALQSQRELGAQMAKALEASVKEIPQQSTALAKMVKEEETDLDLVQLKSQTNFGKSLRVMATVLGGLAFAFTQQYILLAFIGVAWVMAYAFIDHRAIEGAKKKALSSPDPSRTDPD